MRAFIAIDLEKGLIGRVKEIQELLMGAGADVKFVEPGNLHFTVKFLGEISEQDLGGVKKAMEHSLSGFGPFRIGIEGLSCFGSESHLRTLFLDVKLGRDRLQELLNRVSRELDSFRHEAREPKPHLTMGRVRSGRNREALLERIGELSRVKVGEMDVKSVKLKQSMLTRNGPVYSDLSVFELRE